MNTSAEVPKNLSSLVPLPNSIVCQHQSRRFSKLAETQTSHPRTSCPLAHVQHLGDEVGALNLEA